MASENEPVSPMAKGWSTISRCNENQDKKKEKKKKKKATWTGVSMPVTSFKALGASKKGINSRKLHMFYSGVRVSSPDNINFIVIM